MNHLSSDDSIVYLGTESVCEIGKERNMRKVLFLKSFYSFVKARLYVSMSEKIFVGNKNYYTKKDMTLFCWDTDMFNPDRNVLEYYKNYTKIKKCLYKISHKKVYPKFVFLS